MKETRKKYSPFVVLAPQASGFINGGTWVPPKGAAGAIGRSGAAGIRSFTNGAHGYLQKAPQAPLVVLAPQASGSHTNGGTLVPKKGAAVAIGRSGAAGIRSLTGGTRVLKRRRRRHLSFWRRRHPVPLLTRFASTESKTRFLFSTYI